MVKHDLKNGTIKLFRDKFDNTHLNTLNDVELGEKTFGRHEIYSVSDKNESLFTVGDNLENGIISDFFVVADEIHVRYNHIIIKEKDVKIKKSCLKL